MLTEFGKHLYSIIYCGWNGIGGLNGNEYVYDPVGNFKDIYGNAALGFLGGEYNPISAGNGIIFGTNASITSDMMYLQNQSEIYPTNTSSLHPTKNGDVLTQAFTVSNNTETDITYTCFGRAALIMCSYNSSENKTVLVSVNELDAPFTVPANSSKTIEIKFDLSNL